jgi:hypothetical protein
MEATAGLAPSCWDSGEVGCSRKFREAGQQKAVLKSVVEMSNLADKTVVGLANADPLS